MSFGQRDWPTWLQKAEDNLRAGQASRVVKDLAKISWKDVPRKHALKFANVLRRSDQINRGLLILAPIVRPTKLVRVEQATDAEKAEYAVLLHLAGSNLEALELLKEVSPVRVPERDLYVAFTCFAAWDYAGALPYLESYSSSANSPYARNVGLVNLAAAFVAIGETAKAESTLKESLEISEQQKHERLRANALELLAQVHIQKRNYSAALSTLDESLHVLGKENLRDQLYARKWFAIASALQTNDVTAVDTFRAEAARRKDWENLRDADFYSLTLKFDQALFDRLLFGTPNPTFRAKLFREFPMAELKSSCRFGPPEGPEFEVRTGRLTGRDQRLKGKVHQLVSALTKDFYKPLSVAALFAELYPGEHFDLQSSRDRIHQVLRRARREFETLKLEIVLEERDGFYSLNSRMRLLVNMDRKSVRPIDARLELLSELGLKEAVSAGQIQAALQLTPAEFRVFVTTALSEGQMSCTGRRAATRYTLKVKAA